MSDLTEFLNARLDEDEAGANAAASAAMASYWLPTKPADDPAYEAFRAHLVRHDPERVLREVEAKRKIVEQCAHVLVKYVPPVPRGKSGEWAVASLTLEFLAAMYSDHPDYDSAWSPER